MRKVIKKKRALSEMVGYVLLVVIAISLSIIVYEWILPQIWQPKEKCDDGVSLVLEAYVCDSNLNILNITLRNMGTFSVNGFIIRVGNEAGKKPIYSPPAYSETERLQGVIVGQIFFVTPMNPDDSKNFSFLYSNFKSVKSIEIEPTQIKDGKLVLCEYAVTNQEIIRCD